MNMKNSVQRITLEGSKYDLVVRVVEPVEIVGSVMVHYGDLTPSKLICASITL